jgi:hypothetical protein
VRKRCYVSYYIAGECTGVWLQMNLSDLFYWKIGEVDVFRRSCSDNVTFSFDLHFIQCFYELIWDSELFYGTDDLEAD